MRLRIIINMKFLSSITATIDVPIKVADQYNHKFPTDPRKQPGARDRAGIMEDLEINP